MIEITADCESGFLKIYPVIPEIIDELQFVYKHWDYTGGMAPSPDGKRRFFKKQKKLVLEIKQLFLDQDDGSVITHNGLGARVMDALDRLEVPYRYSKIGDWVKPTLTSSVIHDLDHKQVDAVCNLLAQGEYGGAMVDFCTGTGKTRIIAALIKAFKGARIVVATYNVSVVRRLHEGLPEFVSSEGIEVGICHGGIKDIKNVTVCTFGTIDYLSPETVDVLIVDECHTTTGDGVSNNLLKFVKAIRYGLSGTISDRFDGKERILEATFGPIVSRFSDQEAEEAGRVCPLKVYFLSVPDGPMLDGCTSEYRIRHGIWRNKKRNQLVKDVVDKTPEDQQVLVFVTTLEHLNYLVKDFLPDFEVCHGQLSNKERLAIEERFNSGEAKRIISTDCLSTGVDPKQLMVMIDASTIKGEAAMVQKRGRVRRWAPGKTHGILVNFMDEWCDPLHAKAKKRFKEHENRGDQMFLGSKAEEIDFVKV